MNTKLIAALACGAALALGACAGGNPAAPAGPAAPGPADPMDPAAPDDRTAAEKDFDDALDKAKKALADARALVTAAEARAAAARTGTDADRTAAQTDIDAARTALAAAVTAAKALSAPAGDFGRIGAAAIQVDDAEAAEDEDEAKLRRAEGSTGWAGTALLSRAIPRTEVGVVRTARKTVDDTNYADDGNDLAAALTVAKLSPVMYEAGKIVMRNGSGSSGDRLRMRGFPMRWGASGGGLQDTGDTAITLATDDYFDETFAGLTITPAGLAIDLGDAGANPGPDLKIDPDEAIAATTVNRNDLALTFGRPSASPTGNAEHYWAAALMPTAAQVDAASVLKEGTGTDAQTLPVGTYYLRLSNHAGVDTNLEDPDDPVTSARDDVNSYLSYAAYGLFDFVAGSTLTANDADRPRIFPFAAGYDAFKNADNMKVTDVAEADEITSGKFKGRTIAEELARSSSASEVLTPPSASGSTARMLRGDIELTATISGTAGDNTITGTITNFEAWDTKGYWENYDHFTTAALASGSIGADGSFSGVVTDPDGGSGTIFANGFYKGSFYGPLSGLEAAGTWFVPSTALDTTADLSIVGSFGAALVREDGSWGHVVRAGGN